MIEKLEERKSYTRTPEIREKQRLAMIGRYSGKNNPMYGVSRIGNEAPNYKGGVTKPKCLDCGKELYYGSKYCQKHIYTHKRNIGVSRPGETNPNWKGGKSFEPYPLGWTKTFKEQIRRNDNYQCKECGVHEVECARKHHVHHIDYDKSNLQLNNLITLCHKCHAKTTVTKPEKKIFWIQHYRVLRDREA